jgi:hypothetical protein
VATTTGAVGTVRVKGLQELNRALNSYNKDLRKELRASLRVVAKPVKELATELAMGEITNMTAHWARMRLGVAAKSVYIVPYSRNAGGSKRPDDGSDTSFVGLMLGRAMEPALDRHHDDIIHGLELMLDGLGLKHGF